MKVNKLLIMFLLGGCFLNAGLSNQPLAVYKKDSLMDITIESNIASISPKYGLAMVDGGDNGTNLNKYIMPKIEYGKIVLNHQNRKLSVKFGNKKTYLILVALNKYKDKNINLVASISDVKKISNKIRSNTKQVIEYQLFDNEATKDNIIAQFRHSSHL
jgi:ribosomal protein L30E